MWRQIPNGVSLWILSVHPQQSGGASEAALSLGAVNISVNRVTGGQEAMSSLSLAPILNNHFNK